MTKTGDKGTTGIFGGERVPKDDPRIEANGAMDELNAHLGLIRAHISPDDPRHRFYGEVQMRIMQAMSLIATRSERRGENPNHFDLTWVEDLETETARLMAEIPDNGRFSRLKCNSPVPLLDELSAVCGPWSGWIHSPKASSRGSIE